VNYLRTVEKSDAQKTADGMRRIIYLVGQPLAFGSGGDFGGMIHTDKKNSAHCALLVRGDGLFHLRRLGWVSGRHGVLLVRVNDDDVFGRVPFFGEDDRRHVAHPLATCCHSRLVFVRLVAEHHGPGAVAASVVQLDTALHVCAGLSGKKEKNCKIYK
jgi:hypothetical protein